jgi:hypothetical protein
MTTSMLRRYSELRRLETFDERLDYLSLKGVVGDTTFGFDRWMNQQFYTSREWRDARRQVIIRDNGCDLGIPGYEIHVDLLVHHMNLISVRDIENGAEWILDPEYLITTSLKTHNYIHFGTNRPAPNVVLERTPGDTKLW